MNGFKFFLLLNFLFMTSCVSNYVKEYEGDSLFLIYRRIPQSLRGRFNIWQNPQEYVQKEMTQGSNQNLLTLFDTNYLVLRLGTFRQPYQLEKITYDAVNENLQIFVQNSPVSLANSDAGYPIFIKTRKIKKISVLTNSFEAFSTNITIKPLL